MNIIVIYDNYITDGGKTYELIYFLGFKFG